MNAPLTQLVSLAQITADPELQMRADGVSEDAVGDYLEALGARAKFPPLVVYADTDAGTYWLSDGFHRHAAYVRAGWKKVPCEVRKGTRLDALVNSCGANDDHGRRRTRDDKRKAVARLLALFPKLSNRQIAKRAKVSHTFANSQRPEQAESADERVASGNVSTPDAESDCVNATSSTEGAVGQPTPVPAAPFHDVTEEELTEAVALAPSERDELATLADVLRERLEAFAKTPEGADLFTTKVAAGPLVRDVAAMIGTALRAAKPDRGPIFAAERKTVQDVKHAERVDPSERLIEPQCVFLCELLRVLRGAKH